MSYTPQNPVNFEFSVPGYVPTNPVDFVFGKLAIVGDVTYAFSTESTLKITRHRSIVGDVTWSSYSQSSLNYNKYEWPIVGDVTWSIASESVLTYTAKAGGRISLISSYNYVAPSGDEIPLLVSYGNWVVAREAKARLDSTTAILEGSAAILTATLDTVDIDASLEGSVAWTSSAIDTAAGAAELTGASVLAVEPVAVIESTASFVNVMYIEGEIPTLDTDLYLEETQLWLDINTKIPALVGSVGFLGGCDIEASIPTLQGSLRIIEQGHIDVEGEIPALTGGIQLYCNKAISIEAEIPDFTVDLSGVSGQLISINATIPAFKTAYSMTENPVVGISGEIPELDSSILITPPMAISGSIPDWDSEIAVKESMFLIDSVIPEWSSDIELTGYGTMSIQANIPNLINVLQMRLPESISMSARIPSFTGSFLLTGTDTDYMLIDGEIPDLTFSGFSTDMTIDAIIPGLIEVWDGGPKAEVRFA